jgi:hypothetical protein
MCALREKTAIGDLLVTSQTSVGVAGVGGVILDTEGIKK